MRDEPLTVTAAPGSGEGITVLQLEGPLTLQNTFDFQHDLAQHKPAVLILDLTESPYMDSAGLGLLMNCYVSAEKNGRTPARRCERAHPRATPDDEGAPHPEELPHGSGGRSQRPRLIRPLTPAPPRPA